MKYPAVVLGATVLALAVAAPAQADHGLVLSADTNERGWIALHVHGRSGTTVALSEQVGARFLPLPSVHLAGPDAQRRQVARWRCDRRERRFVAAAPGPLGITEQTAANIATPSCRRRLGMRVRRRARAGRRVSVRLRDRFGVGQVRVALCNRAPAGRRRCRRVTIPAGKRARTVRIGAVRPGRWKIDAKVTGGRRLRGRTIVRPRRRLRVLATGDSMIQIVDGYLKQRLPARVRSDARISSGISKPFELDWVRHARGQAAARHDVTVMFIGANDGFPIGEAACCGGAWVRVYARRVRRMMSAYKRGRAGVVYWLTLPAPRDANFASVFGPVNQALERAAASFPEQVRLVDLRKTFTPDGRFHHTIRYRGRDVVVRQPDGVHLSTAGASIAASLVIQALKRDRILP